jgi:hypothetical protein
LPLAQLSEEWCHDSIIVFPFSLKARVKLHQRRRWLVGNCLILAFGEMQWHDISLHCFERFLGQQEQR